MKLCTTCGRRWDLVGPRCPEDGTPLVPVEAASAGRAPAAAPVPISASATWSAEQPVLAQPRPAPPRELAPGDCVGEYVIERRIGAGGMGMVYGARHPVIGKRAAIKILNARLTSDDEALSRFVLEAQAVNRIGHANIVDIFSFGTLDDGRSYFAMEWLQGETLGERLRRGRVAVREAAAILSPLCRALEAAHAAGVIHRDLKPDNVFLATDDDGWRVKLLDFGVAKLSSATAEVSRTATGVAMGTPLYMAPEQARGEAVDGRTDVYALGLVAYTMMCGVSLFEDEGSAIEILAAHITKPPVAPRAHAPDMPAELEALILEMIAKQPDRRPALSEIRRRLAAIATAAERRAPAAMAAPPTMPASIAGLAASRPPDMPGLPPSAAPTRPPDMPGLPPSAAPTRPPDMPGPPSPSAAPAAAGPPTMPAPASAAPTAARPPTMPAPASTAPAAARPPAMPGAAPLPDEPPAVRSSPFPGAAYISDDPLPEHPSMPGAMPNPAHTTGERPAGRLSLPDAMPRATHIPDELASGRLSTLTGAVSGPDDAGRSELAIASRRPRWPFGLAAGVAVAAAVAVVAVRGRSEPTVAQASEVRAAQLRGAASAPPASAVPPSGAAPASAEPSPPVAPVAPASAVPSSGAAPVTAELTVEPARARLVVDGQPVAVVAGRATLALPPGDHEALASAGGRVARQRFTLTAGRDARVALRVPAAPAAAAQRPAAHGDDVDGVEDPFRK